MKKLNAKNFKPYGKIIEYPNIQSKGKVRNLWRIVHTEIARVGWRIAYLVLRDKTIGRMEKHPKSDETFEPVRGKFVMFVSKDRNLQNIECFEIDRPIILYKNIWHGMVSLDDQAEIKLVENAKVKCEYWPFGFRISSMEDLSQRL